jgi:hypothetical protein
MEAPCIRAWPLKKVAPGILLPADWILSEVKNA